MILRVADRVKKLYFVTNTLYFTGAVEIGNCTVIWDEVLSNETILTTWGHWWPWAWMFFNKISR
jgi:hypothetical protein